jgi:hypothetical protein
MEIRNEERLGLRMKGDIWMKLGKNLSRDEVLKNPDRAFHNIIVNVCSNLIASWSCMGNTMAGTLPSVNGWGIRTLAVGTGDPLWDPMAPPAETDTQELLEAELARKAFAATTGVYYVDPITFVPLTDRSNVVEYVATFADAEAVGPLVEMGLFGGSYHDDDGRGNDSLFSPDGGTMCNYKTFAVINKPATAELTIIWRLTF